MTKWSLKVASLFAVLLKEFLFVPSFVLSLYYFKCDDTNDILYKCLSTEYFVSLSFSVIDLIMRFIFMVFSFILMND